MSVTREALMTITFRFNIRIDCVFVAQVLFDRIRDKFMLYKAGLLQDLDNLEDIEKSLNFEKLLENLQKSLSFEKMS